MLRQAICRVDYALFYLFSTTTVNYEKAFLFLTVTAELPDTAAPAPFQGRIVRIK